MRETRLIPESGRSPEERNGNPLQYSCLENPMDRGTWQLSYPSRKVMCVLVARSCLTLCDPTDYSPPGFSVHGILQARILEWIAISFSRGTSQQESNPGFLHGRQILYHLSYREVPYLGRGHPFNITVIQVCAPMSNAQETEVEQFYETYKTF